MKHTESFTVTWTDGGNPGNLGYFDGAGSMNTLLMCIFGGEDDWHREGLPIGMHITGGLKYGTRLRVTISLEEEKG